MSQAWAMHRIANGKHTIVCLVCGYRIEDQNAAWAINVMENDHKCDTMKIQ